jgi:HEAT repeat protein
MVRALVVLALLSPRQDESTQKLVEQLKSDQVDERDQAGRAIEALGRKAAPALEKAARDADVDLAARARFLLRLIDLRETLSPRLRKADPGIERRLATGDDAAWTRAFLDLTGLDQQRSRAFSGLDDADLAPLAAQAVRGASSARELTRVAEAAAERLLATAVPDLARRLDWPESRLNVSYALATIGGPEAVAALRARLRNPDPDTRTSAIGALRLCATRECLLDILPFLKEERTLPDALTAIQRIGTAEGGQALVQLFSTDTSKSKPFIAAALGRLRVREALPLLRPLFSDPNDELRVAAIKAAIEIDRKESIPDLAKAVNRAPALARGWMIRSLLDLEAKEGLPLLLELLRNADRLFYADSWSWHSFVQRNADDLIPKVLPLLQSGNGDVRAAAAYFLGGFQRRDLARVIRPLIGDPDPDARFRAAHACARLDDRDAAPAIRRLLDDPSSEVRQAAMRALGQLRDEAALPALYGFLETEDDDVAAGCAVGDIGSARSRKTLRRLLRHEESEVAARAAIALCRLKEKSALPEIIDLLGRADGFQSPRIAEALRSFEAAEAVPPLERFLKEHPEHPACWYGIRTLARLGLPEAVPLLRKLAGPGDDLHRIYAIRGLSECAPRDALDIALPLLKDPEPSIRLEAMTAIARVRAVDRAAAVAALLSDPEAYVRAGAAESLGRLSATAHIRDLETTLLDRVPSVRLAAANALLELGSPVGADTVLYRAYRSGRGNQPEYLRLNALRNPESWKRLRTRVLDRDLPLNPSAIMEWLPRETGLPLIHEPALGVTDQTWIRNFWTSPVVPKGSTLLEAIEQVMEGSMCELILEKDGLRYLYYQEAWEFWSDWWKKQGR